MHDDQGEYGGRPVSERDLQRMERWGWALFVIWAAMLVAYAVWRPNPYAEGWKLVLELMFLGRIVSIYEGIVLGCSNTYLILQNVTQDIILLLVAYPWVVRGYERSFRGSRFDRFLFRLTDTAGQHQPWLKPFGVFGLWAFVFFPFWSTGALVGGVVGYLLGMRTRTVFATVFVGHGLSVLSLVYLFDWLEPAMRRIDEGLARFFPWILIGVAFIVGWLYKTFKKRRASD